MLFNLLEIVVKSLSNHNLHWTMSSFLLMCYHCGAAAMAAAAAATAAVVVVV